uniref:Uncharacterized protein n=1 Tax=Eutreptiella gymnastica TaxID=73025 RepID=A0A7S4GDQ6_9EUGL
MCCINLYLHRDTQKLAEGVKHGCSRCTQVEEKGTRESSFASSQIHFTNNQILCCRGILQMPQGTVPLIQRILIVALIEALQEFRSWIFVVDICAKEVWQRSDRPSDALGCGR